MKMADEYFLSDLFSEKNSIIQELIENKLLTINPESLENEELTPEAQEDFDDLFQNGFLVSFYQLKLFLTQHTNADANEVQEIIGDLIEQNRDRITNIKRLRFSEFDRTYKEIQEQLKRIIFQLKSQLVNKDQIERNKRKYLAELEDLQTEIEEERNKLNNTMPFEIPKNLGYFSKLDIERWKKRLKQYDSMLIETDDYIEGYKKENIIDEAIILMPPEDLPTDYKNRQDTTASKLQSMLLVDFQNRYKNTFKEIQLPQSSKIGQFAKVSLGISQKTNKPIVRINNDHTSAQRKSAFTATAAYFYNSSNKLNAHMVFNGPIQTKKEQRLAIGMMHRSAAWLAVQKEQQGIHTKFYEVQLQFSIAGMSKIKWEKSLFDKYKKLYIKEYAKLDSYSEEMPNKKTLRHSR